MKGIFGGCLLILINLSIITGRYPIALPGSCAGCIILIIGLRKLIEKSNEFRNARNLSALLAFDIIIAAVFGRLRMEYGYMPDGMDFVDAVITAILQILVLKMITAGIRDMEEQYRLNLGGAELTRAWKWLAVFQVITLLSLIIPIFPTFTEVLAVAMSLIFLLELKRVTRRFQEWEECI